MRWSNCKILLTDITLKLFDGREAGLVQLDEVDVTCEMRGTKNNSIACSADGARFSMKRIAVPKLINEDYLPGGADYNYYTISGTFKRRDFFLDTLKGPLTAVLIACPNVVVADTNEDCIMKGKSKLSATCIKP